MSVQSAKNPIAHPEMPLAVSRQQAARLLDCSIQMIDKMVKAGRIPARKLGTKVLIRVADLEAALEAWSPQRPRGARKNRRAA